MMMTFGAFGFVFDSQLNVAGRVTDAFELLSCFVHDRLALMTFDFAWSQFLWIAFIFVGVPSVVCSLLLWRRSSAEEDGTGSGRLGLWPTGLLAFVFGFASCAGWLTWSADQRGEFREPGLPAPYAFPTWQVIACGVTVVITCLFAAHLSRWSITGGYAAALGVTAGFSTAFCVEASTDTTGQSGVGVLLCVIGWGLSLGVLMCIRSRLRHRGWRGFITGF